MSEPKRPGSRDISDLKARLGLKKGAPAGSPVVPPPPSGGGIAPPPGVTVQPPPGVPRATAPAVPSATDDPFGAMNAMAQVGTMQRAPEIVIVNDGKPVEDVAAGKKAARIGKYAAIAAVPLVFGIVIGQVAKGGEHFNDGIRAAGAILGNVKTVKKTLGEVETILSDSAKSGHKPHKDVTGKLTLVLSKIKPNSELYFRAKQSSMSAQLSGEILTFYSTVDRIHAMLDAHVNAAKQDDAALAQAVKAGDAARMTEAENPLFAGGVRYAVVLRNPSDEEKAAGRGGAIGATIVELGPLWCGDALAKEGGCPNGLAPDKQSTRGESGSSFQKMGLPQLPGPGAAFPPNTIIPMVRNGVLDGMVRGTVPSVTEASYVRRLQELTALLAETLNMANAPERGLKANASQGEKFTFFL